MKILVFMKYVLRSLGYEVDEISFEELVKRVEGEIEIIEI
jgi:ribosomal protein L12E/L44/L45/RPP1/RPP2